MTTPIDVASLRRIQVHDPRRVWINEALQFTPWLAEHIGELNEAIGVEIELSAREMRVGPFAVDLYGTEVQTGHPAIIENQLEQTDHSHLGQILTYAAGLKAGVVVWIARRLETSTRRRYCGSTRISPDSVNFFGVELEILEIGGQYAPNFKLVAEPNSWQKAGTSPKRPGIPTVSDRNLRYQAYFAELLDELKRHSPGITAASKTQPASWFWFASGKAGVNFSLAFVSGRRFRIELSIDTADRTQNKAILDGLLADREGVEAALGFPIIEDVIEGRRQMRLEAYPPFEITIDSPQDELTRLKEWAVPTMIRFVEVLRPRLKSLQWLDIAGPPAEPSLPV